MSPQVMTRRQGLYVTIALLGTIAAIALIDWVTGANVVVSVLYSVPIVAAAWLLRVPRAITVTAVATAAWLLCDVAWRGIEAPPAARIWNAFAGVLT